MSLLIIISQYLPAQTPNTIRWVPIIEKFIKQGYSVNILTTKRSGQSTAENSDRYKVYRTGFNTLQDALSDFLGSSKRRNETGSSSHSYRPSKTKALTEKLVSFFWRKSYWPDGSKLFLKPGIKLGSKIIQDEKVSHIISVGLPFTCHLIAQALKKENKDIHWHMDIEDPFCYSKEFWVNNFDRYEKKNIEAERSAFALANSISLTNKVAKNKYEELFGAAEKMSVIPPLFGQYESSSKLPLSLYQNKVHLGYFGSFYTGVRSPQPFLNFLKSLDDSNPELKNKIQFHFFGQQNKFSYPIFKKYPELQDYIILHGFYNRDQSIDAMKQMDFLINFGNSTDYHLPSKVVDFLYINKPLVNFTSIENDSVTLFLKDYPSILNLKLDKDSADIKKHFLDFVSDKNIKRSETDFIKDKYDTSAIASQYLKALEI